MEHPIIRQIMLTGYPSDNQPDEFYCDCCGDPVEGDVFEYDGDIYCTISCLTKSTDVNFGNVYQFK